MAPERDAPGGRDWWPLALFGLHLGQALLLGALYPHVRYDTDLLAYFVYFRSWLAGDPALHALPFFTVPKPLLVFGLGAVHSVPVAFLCSAVASAALGSLVYVVGRDVFGRPVGVLLSLFLLLDVEKATLALKSKADLWVALLFFWTMSLALRRRVAGASVTLLLSALVKPVTLPCVLYFLVAEGIRPRQRAWALLPLAAVPLILLSDRLLTGSALGPARFFASFAALREGDPIGAGEVLHFALWTQIARHAFAWTAPWGGLGLALWLARDKTRLTSPFFLLPLFFLGGWVGLAVVSAYAPFFRFFWPVQVWFLAFVLCGVLETARWLARGRRPLAGALAGALLVLVANDQLRPLASYRDRAILPFERSMAFVESTTDVLRRERRAGETIASPLAFLPYLMWALRVPGADVIIAPGHAADGSAVGRPDWILYLPDPSAGEGAQAGLARLLGGGYALRLADGDAALLERAPRG